MDGRESRRSEAPDTLQVVPDAKALIRRLLAQRSVQEPLKIADLISCTPGSQGLSLFNVACISLKQSNTRNQAKAVSE